MPWGPHPPFEVLFLGLPGLPWALEKASHGSFSSVVSHRMGLPRKAKKEGKISRKFFRKFWGKVVTLAFGAAYELW